MVYYYSMGIVQLILGAILILPFWFGSKDTPISKLTVEKLVHLLLGMILLVLGNVCIATDAILKAIEGLK